MITMSDTEQPVERAEGDVNLSPRRQKWATRHLNDETATMLDEDARFFLHQSLSTPCLNALQSSNGIYLEDLQVDSPYNTYLFSGLPPGPIATPGLAALEAVADPTPTDFIFFVVD